jgi:anhydro-N-acetylmuramic acid kinase
MQHLQTQLPGCTILSTAETGINPDAKEAALFALLANECICSNIAANEIKFPGIPAVAMGKISFPA